jgi:aminopeptidase N
LVVLGFYRIDYDDNLWEKIKVALTHTDFDGIHELNRAQIVDDFYNFAKVGLHSYSSFLDLIKFLDSDSSFTRGTPPSQRLRACCKEQETKQLEQVFMYVSGILSNHISPTIYLQEFIWDLMGLLYSVPFKKAKHNDQIYTHQRVLAATWACRQEFKHCIDKSLAAYNTYKETKP